MKSIWFITLLSIFLGCREAEVPPDRGLDLQDELALSAVLKEELAEPNSIYGPVLNRGLYSSLYDYLYAVQNSILASGDLQRVGEINYEPIIIYDNSKYQAFSLPGGPHYYYSGLLLYLENEAQLAALMSKEMSHNDAVDPFNRMANVYGEDLILQVIQGGQPDLRQEMITHYWKVGIPRTMRKQQTCNP